jgi:HD-GYP domain-containing protein (c-di-GMP phosphodiesterase class II)
MPEERDNPRDESRHSFFLQQQLVNTAKTAFHQLGALIRSAQLYPPAHPSLLSSAEQFLLALEDLFARKSEAVYYFIAGELFFETFSVPIEEPLSVLIESFIQKDMGGLIFRPGLTRQELVSFAYLMNRDRGAIIAQGGISALLAREGVAHITAHAVLPMEGKAKEEQKKTGKKPSEVFLDAIDTVKEIVHSAHAGKVVNVRKIQSTIQVMVDNIMDNRDVMIGLTSIKLYDEYTFAHSVNVSMLCIAMGAFLAFDKPQIAALGLAGMLHDIGKVNVPLDIINKPDSLTDAEWEVMKRHPIEGALILTGLSGVSPLAIVAAFEHHLHHDAKGYPQVGDFGEMHPFSQIVAIADAYDALTSIRVYYNIPKAPDEAVRVLLKKRGTNFNPMLVKAFVNLVGIFPIGTLVRLSTGEAGLVVHQTGDLLRPKVLVLRTFDGTETEETSLLEMEQGRYKRSILDSLEPQSMNVDVSLYFK